MLAAAQAVPEQKVVAVQAKVVVVNNADKADNVVPAQAAQAVTEIGTAVGVDLRAVMLLQVVAAAVAITVAVAVAHRAVTATAEPVAVEEIVQDNQQLQAVGVVESEMPADYGLDHMDSAISQAEL
jgi:hypothetical protein